MKQARSFCNTHLTLSDFLDGGTEQRRKENASLQGEICDYVQILWYFCYGLLHGWFAIRFYTAKCLKGRV